MKQAYAGAKKSELKAGEQCSDYQQRKWDNDSRRMVNVDVGAMVDGHLTFDLA